MNKDDRLNIVKASWQLHDEVENAYLGHPAKRGDDEWLEKQRILLAVMALHLLQTSIKPGAIELDKKFMLRGSEPNKIKNWVCILERGTEYEVELAKSYLSNLKIPSNILSKRDSSYSFNFGEMSMVYLYVPKEFEQRARKALAELNEQDDHFDRNEDGGD